VIGEIRSTTAKSLLSAIVGRERVGYTHNVRVSHTISPETGLMRLYRSRGGRLTWCMCDASIQQVSLPMSTLAILKCCYFQQYLLMRLEKTGISLFLRSYTAWYLMIAALVLLSRSTLVHAQKEKLHVLIKDGRLEHNVGVVDKAITSSAYSVIEADQFRNSFISLPQLLEQEIGVQMRTTGGVGSASTIVLRGASSEQVVIYINGIPVNNASGGLTDLSFISPNNIERIEIYRGSTPLALGSPSIGGAVNIITRRSTTENIDSGGVTGQLSASVASFHAYRLNGSINASRKKDDYLFAVSYLQSENDYSFVNDNGTQFNTEDDVEEKRNNAGVKQWSLLANWKHKLNAEHDIDFQLDYFDRQKEIPSATNNADVQTQFDTQKYNLLGQFNARNVFIANLNINAKLFSTKKDEVFDDSLAQAGFFNQHIERTTTKNGVQLYLEKNNEQSQWKFLSSISREDYEQDNTQARIEIGDNVRERFEFSAENISYYQQQKFILNVVLRYQNIDDKLGEVKNNSGLVSSAVEKKHVFFNPQLGAKYRFSQNVFFTANAGQYERLPSFLELFGSDGLLIGNTNLKQESSINSDVGLTYTWYKPYNWLHNTELYTGLFYNKVDDLIVRIFNGQGIGLPVNISDAIIKGFEAKVKFSPVNNHKINISFSLIDSVNKTEVTSFSEKILPGYYQQSLNLYYAYILEHWLLNADFSVKRKAFYDRSNLLKSDDVNLLSFSAKRSFSHSSIEFRINNILDENIQYFRGRPTPGREFSLTYNYSF